MSDKTQHNTEISRLIEAGFGDDALDCKCALENYATLSRILSTDSEKLEEYEAVLRKVWLRKLSYYRMENDRLREENREVLNKMIVLEERLNQASVSADSINSQLIDVQNASNKIWQDLSMEIQRRGECEKRLRKTEDLLAEANNEIERLQ